MPTSVEPVKLILRTRSSESSAGATASGSDAVTRLATPGGKPARSMAENSSPAASGVCSAGLTTIVQPAASPGASLRTIMYSGKFHGVIANTTPTGWRSTINCLPAMDGGTISP